VRLNRSAPVLGRSDGERLSVVGKTSAIERADIAAPGDGRTPNGRLMSAGVNTNSTDSAGESHILTFPGKVALPL
jgi:hypothetical protein